MNLNILLDFCSIAGDIIVLQIDRRSREFKSLSQENIIWFTEVLNRRSPNNIDFSKDYNPNYNNSFSNVSSVSFNARQNNNQLNNNLQNNNNQNCNQQNNNFDSKLLDVLTNINLTLSYLVMNNKK